MTFRLHGFRDNGLLADTDFELDVELRFGLTWGPTFTEPDVKTLIVELKRVSVTAHGLGAHSVAQGVADGVKDALKEPKRIIDIPVGTDPDFMDLLVTSDGALQFLVNPLPQAPLNAGALRQVIAQQKIDAFLDG